ncbi:phosphatidate phosphatase PAH1-like [Glycine soja]|uniref:phosphatidate phosphatase n=1 Tax=Glycine soja TaxID=3848 RepID=A0A445HFL7_GLYSO|nr:phosphatidate phosphatase PAH1-like [Glycine soja]KHN48349.1 Phosphatidate phosphatase LPIN2-like protein [Glycine soja]RZB72366.1 Phosphatidate phosphatase PAH1 isoform A [Glycine soja]
MNVVGKVGSLITQGVYSVATPFHPFGGAVDVIVVQQQDGTFRSTPWYVRFGKFQGVLKGAEKFVRINVNGVEANFHMYLDNSGEAYFLKEVDDDKGVDSIEAVQDSIDKKNGYLINVHRLDHSISDSGVLRLKDESDSLVVSQLQRAESDIDRRFYEFPDDRSSLEDSVELSEYESNSYESLEGDNFGESQGSHPEMVLVSVDGHILTAPISESEQAEENVQLKTPQFHLGPGEETDLREGNGEFSTGENAWAAGYINQLGAQTTNVQPRRCDTNGDDNTSKLLLKLCQGEEAHICEAQDTLEIKNQDHIKTDSKGAASGIKRENVFKSYLELQDFGQQAGNADLQDIGSSLEIQNSAEESNASCPVVDENEQESIAISKNGDELSPHSGSTSSNGHRSLKSELEIQEVEKNASGKIETASGSHSVTTDTEQNDEHVDKSVSNDELDESQQTPALKDVRATSEVVEPQTETSNKGDQSHLGLGFEMSLCGHELKVGMGSIAAAEVFEAHRISVVDFTSSAPSIIKNQNLVIKFKERYMTWEKAAPLVLGMAVYGLDLPVESKDTIPVEQDHALKSRDDDLGSSSSGRRWRLWPIPFRKVKTFEHTNSNSSNEEVFLDSESGSLIEPTPTSSTQGSSHKQFLRTNVPTTEQIASLNLKEGQNLVTFSFSTRVLGTQQVDAHIYLWKWNARIVISDVDGTITKSDVLGQFMPLVGKDWTQSGVARLFCAIKENGYQLLFLSARAIVQAYLTRNFLLNLKQDGKTLPNGPVVISPDGLFPSLYREVIRRAPHEFKIACLEDIKRLFPSDYNPFYAGFGNRDTDELSYRKIGVPKGKIFIINPKGEVAISHRIGAKSYTSLHTLVNDMFPPTSLVEQEDYNSWNYWKTPLPDID